MKDSITSKFDIDEIIDWFTFGLIKEKGKINLGTGDNSVGDLLPQMFSQLKLRDIKAHLSDKVNVIIPPYQSNEIRSMLGFRLENKFKEFMKAETKTQFERFGGKYKELRHRVEKKLDTYKSELRDTIENQTYYDASTALMYLVSGT